MASATCPMRPVTWKSGARPGSRPARRGRSSAVDRAGTPRCVGVHRRLRLPGGARRVGEQRRLRLGSPARPAWPFHVRATRAARSSRHRGRARRRPRPARRELVQLGGRDHELDVLLCRPSSSSAISARAPESAECFASSRGAYIGLTDTTARPPSRPPSRDHATAACSGARPPRGRRARPRAPRARPPARPTATVPHPRSAASRVDQSATSSSGARSRSSPVRASRTSGPPRLSSSSFSQG